MSQAQDAKEANEVLGRFIQSLNAYTGLARTLGIDRMAGRGNLGGFDIAAEIRRSERSSARRSLPPVETFPQDLPEASGE